MKITDATVHYRRILTISDPPHVLNIYFEDSTLWDVMRKNGFRLLIHDNLPISLSNVIFVWPIYAQHITVIPEGDVTYRSIRLQQAPDHNYRYLETTHLCPLVLEAFYYLWPDDVFQWKEFR